MPLTTVNQEYHDAQVRHQTYLHRHALEVFAALLALLQESEDPIAAMIRTKLDDLSEASVSTRWEQLQPLIEKLKRLRGAAWDKLDKELNSNLQDLGDREQKSQVNILAAVLPFAYTPKQLSKTAINSLVSTVPTDGRSVAEWLETMQSKDTSRIVSGLQMGVMNGMSPSAVARTLVGTKTLNQTDGLFNDTTNALLSTVKTLIVAVTGNVKNEFNLANTDILANERFTAVLDGKTTALCRSLDGNIYPVGQGPIPPLHFNCRSIRVAIIAPDAANDRDVNAATERGLVSGFADENGLSGITKESDIPKSQQAAYDAYKAEKMEAAIGTVPADETYESWLDRQSQAFQEDTLGVTKAKLFRDGKLSLDAFVAHDGSELSLEQLAKTESAAFVRAGLDPKKYL